MNIFWLTTQETHNIETPGTLDKVADKSEHAKSSKVVEQKVRLVLSSKEMVDSRTKADKHVEQSNTAVTTDKASLVST